MFGFVAVRNAQVSLQYIFCLCNAFQGFLIFLLHVVRDKTSRNFWLTLLRCRKPKLTNVYRNAMSSLTSSELKAQHPVKDVRKRKQAVVDDSKDDSLGDCKKKLDRDARLHGNRQNIDKSRGTLQPHDDFNDRRKISVGGKSVDTTISALSDEYWPDSPCTSIESMDSENWNKY